MKPLPIYQGWFMAATLHSCCLCLCWSDGDSWQLCPAGTLHPIAELENDLLRSHSPEEESSGCEEQDAVKTD